MIHLIHLCLYCCPQIDPCNNNLITFLSIYVDYRYVWWCYGLNKYCHQPFIDSEPAQYINTTLIIQCPKVWKLIKKGPCNLENKLQGCSGRWTTDQVSFLLRSLRYDDSAPAKLSRTNWFRRYPGRYFFSWTSGPYYVLCVISFILSFIPWKSILGLCCVIWW